MLNSNSKKKILYAHTSTPDYVRCNKFLYALNKFDCDLYFFGAKRIDGALNTIDPALSKVNMYFHKSIMPHGLSSITSLIKYILQLRRLIKNIKPDILILTNEELVLATFFLKFKGCLILDAIDALDIRTKRNFLLKFIFKKITNYSRNKVNYIIEVEEFRKEIRQRYLNKTFVIRNSPSYNLIKNISENFSFILPEKYIYASGSLNPKVNGIETIIEAIKSVKGVSLVVAGFISDKKLIDLMKISPSVFYLGPVSFKESLLIASKSLAMFAHYNPQIENFRLAAPNKVYEAMALGNYILINSETVISEFCKRNKFGLTTNYGDVKNLIELLNLLENDGLEHLNRENLKNNFKLNYSWECQEEKMTQIINSMGIRLKQ